MKSSVGSGIPAPDVEFLRRIFGALMFLAAASGTVVFVFL